MASAEVRARAMVSSLVSSSKLIIWRKSLDSSCSLVPVLLAPFALGAPPSCASSMRAA